MSTSDLHSLIHAHHRTRVALPEDTRAALGVILNERLADVLDL